LATIRDRSASSGHAEAMVGRAAGTAGRGLPLATVVVGALALGACAGGGEAVVPTSVTATAARTLTIAATGEILPHPSVVDHAGRAGAASGSPFDFSPMFAELAPLLSAADLAVCHLEVPVAPSGTPLSGYPDFAIPAEIGAGIKAGGWDRCSTASNHSNDRGTAGIRATLDALDAAGVGHRGTARSAEEAAASPIVDAGGVPVAHLSYTWGFNGTPVAEPWMADVIDPDRILADAATARAAGARLVVVSLHWGVEHQGVVDEQRALADRLLASTDVDLIVGHGPHVLQPIEQRQGKWVLMSLGNLVANQGRDRPSTYDGAVVTVTFTERLDGRFEASVPAVRPTWYDPQSGRVRLVQPSLTDPTLAPLHEPLRASLTRTTAVLGPYVQP
jgi:poly-gamma-glutamate synthesis protein (capsule biosynthesis protein)